MNSFTKFFPSAIVAIFAFYAVGKMIPQSETYKGFDLSAFGAIPVVDGGRVKPLDSIARTNMLFISGRSDWDDPNGNSQPAILWLLEVLAAGDPNASPIADYRVFRIDNEQVLAELGLEYRPGSYRYSWNEIRAAADKFGKAYLAAEMREERRRSKEKVPDEERDLFHGKILELARRMHAYEELAYRRTPAVVPSGTDGGGWLSLASIDAEITDGYETSVRMRTVAQVDEILIQQGKDPKHLSPSEAGRRQSVIKELMAATLRELADRDRPKESPAATAFINILAAYQDNKPKAFSENIANYRSEYIKPFSPPLRDTTKFELAFNAASPFIIAAFMYVFAGVFMSLSWLGWTEPLRKSAFGLAAVALVLHVGGLLGRMYLMDRPLVFVTNLYSSALLIGAAGVAACLGIERIFKNGIGLVAGTILGAATVKIAHHLSTDGSDTLGMLEAVLDTNFWLASHVTTITLGYSATYLAGLLGIAYIIWGLFSTTLTYQKHITIGNMIYGVTCFATLLSFVGTVLGGIWADQSWGRFWGWDPKENGAVLIVIWNSLILHARWSGLVKQRGMAVLTVFGIMVTTWSWFGTNQLGVGLHAYGFNKSLADGCKWTWITCLVLIGLGLIPLKYWRSFAGTGVPRRESTAELPPVDTDDATEQVVSHQTPEPILNGHAANGQPRPAKGKKVGKKR